MFMDYMGLPHIPSHLRNFPWAFDFPSRRAVVSGTGNELITMTYSKDLARFVARLVDEDEWSEWSFISGSDVTQNQIVAIAEKAIGDKLAVTYDTLEELKAGKATVLFPNEESYGGMDTMGMMAMLGASVAEGEMLLPKGGRLNDRFPEVQTTSIDDLITRAWTGK
jgi:nucleoside-diphosphate-sugar epimerase